MRRIATISIAMCLFGSADAQKPTTVRQMMDQYCILLESAAVGIMADRQSGKLMSEAVKRVFDTIPSSPEITDDPSMSAVIELMKDAMREVAIEAYSQPRRRSEDQMREAAFEFGSQQYAICQRAILEAEN